MPYLFGPLLVEMQTRLMQAHYSLSLSLSEKDL